MYIYIYIYLIFTYIYQCVNTYLHDFTCYSRHSMGAPWHNMAYRGTRGATVPSGWTWPCSQNDRGKLGWCWCGWVMHGGQIKLEEDRRLSCGNRKKLEFASSFSLFYSFNIAGHRVTKMKAACFQTSYAKLVLLLNRWHFSGQKTHNSRIWFFMFGNSRWFSQFLSLPMFVV